METAPYFFFKLLVCKLFYVLPFSSFFHAQNTGGHHRKLNLVVFQPLCLLMGKVVSFKGKIRRGPF